MQKSSFNALLLFSIVVATIIVVVTFVDATSSLQQQEKINRREQAHKNRFPSKQQQQSRRVAFRRPPSMMSHHLTHYEKNFARPYRRFRKQQQQQQQQKQKKHATTISSSSVTLPPAVFPDFTTMQLWQCNSSYIGQKWFVNKTDHTLRLLDSPNNCAEVWMGSKKTGALVNMWDCTSSLVFNEHFHWNKEKNQIISNYSGLCVGYKFDNVATTIELANCTTNASITTWKYDETLGTLNSPSGLCLDAGSDFNPPCTYESNKKLPFCDTSLSYDERAEDLVKRIPTFEMVGRFSNDATAIGSLKIPSWQWDDEALHGLAPSQGITYSGKLPFVSSFPQVCTTAASFNKTLFYVIGNQISIEARSLYNYHYHAYATYFAPNLNIARVLWGRQQECPGEDPYLSSIYALNWVRGFQNSTSTNSLLRASATCKHLMAYSLENWGDFYRQDSSFKVSKSDLWDTFSPAIEVCVSPDGAAASGAMCAYDALAVGKDGKSVPNCANKEILTDMIRNRWKFDGYVISDCGATSGVIDGHDYVNTSAEVVKVTFEAGMDQELSGGGQTTFLTRHIPEALKKKLITRETLETALKRQFKVLMRFDAFVYPKNVPQWGKYTPKDVNTSFARKLALEAAEEGTVLLFNKQQVLPLKKSGAEAKIAVLGPHANSTSVLQGSYYGPAAHIVSPIEGIRMFAPNAKMFQGIDVVKHDLTKLPEACKIAREATDGVILAMGLSPKVEGEGLDRVTTRFPAVQSAFISEISRCAAGNPVILVTYSGGGVDIRPFIKNPFVGAAIWGGYPAEQAGAALANIIFGKVSPSGRLPHTVYPAEYAETIDYTDMRMESDKESWFPGQTYRFLDTSIFKPVFSFGHGLTYTQWKISDATASSSLQSISSSAINAASTRNVLMLNSKVGTVTVTLENIGRYDSQYSVLLKVQPIPCGSLLGGQVADFGKVFVPSGGKQSLTLEISAMSLIFWNETANARTAASSHWRWFIEDDGAMMAQGHMQIL